MSFKNPKSNSYQFKQSYTDSFSQHHAETLLHLAIFHFHSCQSVNVRCRQRFPVEHKLFVIEGPLLNILHTSLT